MWMAKAHLAKAKNNINFVGELNDEHSYQIWFQWQLVQRFFWEKTKMDDNNRLKWRQYFTWPFKLNYMDRRDNLF